MKIIIKKIMIDEKEYFSFIYLFIFLGGGDWEGRGGVDGGFSLLHCPGMFPIFSFK